MNGPAIIILLATVVVSRIISERGYRGLDSEDKVRLMDGFSQKRMYSMLPLLALIGLYWFLSTQTEFDGQLLTIVYFGLLVLYVIISAVINQKILMRLQMPKDYCRLFSAAQVISLCGIAWFFFAILNET